MLYVVATPIGNLNDITLRALDTLQEVDLIACEDTRHTSKLLNHYEIKKPLVSYHQHSKLSKIDYLIDQLKEGKKIALVSDAGTPGISDPGQALISEAIKQGIEISPIPGPSAIITALQASGLNLTRFAYYGFVPTKKGRQTALKEIMAETKPVVVYESRYRIRKLLSELTELGDPEVIICKELTKLYETFYRGRASTIEVDVPKGEYVVIINP